jgi:hypothetical protein
MGKPHFLEFTEKPWAGIGHMSLNARAASPR